MGGVYNEAQARATKKYLKGNKKWLAYMKKYKNGMKLLVIKHYSKNNPRCMCKGCTVTMFEFLIIDHIEKGGTAHRRKINKQTGLPFYRWLRDNGFPKGYQVLCFNCNIAKSHNNNKCPHLN